MRNRKVVIKKIVSPEGKIISKAKSVIVTQDAQAEVEQIVSTSSTDGNSSSSNSKSNSSSFLK